MRRTDFTFNVFGKIVPTVDPWSADETNSELLERMKRALRVAVENDLSARQREVVTMFFFENMKNYIPNCIAMLQYYLYKTLL